jgi:cephalosporin-C deacetylase-like acetyl esterase
MTRKFNKLLKEQVLNLYFHAGNKTRILQKVFLPRRKEEGKEGVVI